MNKKNLFIAVVVVIAVIVALFFGRNIDSKKTQNSTTPSYLKEKPKVYVTQPLYLKGIKDGKLTTGQRQLVDDFKRQIITRTKSNEPLSQSEKIIFAVCISTTTKPVTDGLTLVDQNIFKFTDREVSLISKMLKK